MFVILTCFNIAVLLVAVNALLGLGLMVCVAPAGLWAITPATPAPPPATPAPAVGVHRVCLCAIYAEIGNCFLHLPHWNMSSSSAEILHTDAWFTAHQRNFGKVMFSVVSVDRDPPPLVAIIGDLFKLV